MDQMLASRLLKASGALLALAGLLMTFCVKPVYGILLFVAAACMFFASRCFRVSEVKGDADFEENEQD